MESLRCLLECLRLLTQENRRRGMRPGAAEPSFQEE
jgi:hypothetical protein